jgi:class 3 adenylate cyclase/tetratricopeptide (TPR) repeat protein
MKQVSVLCCDIVNSTPLSERLGPEAMRDLVSEFLDTSLVEVHRYGGSAPQFSGDGFMALFGAPQTHEDHVQRALLTALSIQQALGADETESKRPGLAVRIGVHSGPVVFGPIGATLPKDPTAIGDTANIAARLQHEAEPGSILLSEATWLLARGCARVAPFGPITFKGKAEPILAYQLLDVSHRRFELGEGAPPRATTFVNRASELAILNNCWRQVEGGHSQAVGLVGEPGIGKSRLLAEFRRRLGGECDFWVEGRCVSYGSQIPYWLVLDLLRSNCRIAENDTQAVITEKVRSSLQEVGMDPGLDSSLLLQLFGTKNGGSSATQSSPGVIKEKTFEALSQLSIKRSLRRPLVLALEDLHWIDKISEEFLGFLVENLPGARVLLIATYRPGYRPPWIDKSYAGQTPIQPLSRDDSLNLVRSALRAERVVESVSEEIVAKGDGNPFFLEQLALHAGEARDIRSDLMVPNSIHDVVMARIDRLPDQTKELLQIASVIGREFSLPVLSAVSASPGSIKFQLNELTRLEFIDERFATEGTSYVFRHALTQESVYGSLLERQRRNLHSAVGHALEQLYAGQTDEAAELLALHFGRSEEAGKAVDYAISAAEKSQRRWANAEALAYFDGALHRLDTMPDNTANRLRRVDAVINQAEVKFALGQHAEHIEALDQISGIVGQIDDPRRRAAWHYWRGFLHTLTGGRPDFAIDHCDKARAIAAEAGLDELKAFADSCLTGVYMIAGRLRDAVEAGDRAVLVFEARNNPWWASRTLWSLIQTAIYLGQWDLSLAYCDRALLLAKNVDDLRLRVVALYRTGSAHILQGNVERGLRCCDEALALSPIPFDIAMAKVFRGYGLVKAGQLQSGIADLREAISWLEAAGLSHVRLPAALRLADGYLRCGEIAAARALIDDVLSSSRAGGYYYLEGLANYLMAECVAAEAPAVAMQHVAAAQGIFATVDARNDLAKTLVTQARLSQRSGNIAEARRLLEEAGEIFAALGTVDEPDRVSAALAAMVRGSPILPLGARL